MNAGCAWIVRYRASNGWEFRSKRFETQSAALLQALRASDRERVEIVAIEGASTLEGEALQAAIATARSAAGL